MSCQNLSARCSAAQAEGRAGRRAPESCCTARLPTGACARRSPPAVRRRRCLRRRACRCRYCIPGTPARPLPSPGPCIPGLCPSRPHPWRCSLPRIPPSARNACTCFHWSGVSLSRIASRKRAFAFSSSRPRLHDLVDLGHNRRVVGRVRAHQRLHRQLGLLQVGLQIDQLLPMLQHDAVHRLALLVGELQPLHNPRDCSTSSLFALPARMSAPWEADGLRIPGPSPGRHRTLRRPPLPPAKLPQPPKPTVLPFLPSSISPPPRHFWGFASVLPSCSYWLRPRPSVEPAAPWRLEHPAIHRCPPWPANPHPLARRAARQPASAASLPRAAAAILANSCR